MKQFPAIIRIIKIDDEYRVQLWVDTQGFTIETGVSESNARWFADMLYKAISKTGADVLVEESEIK
jgi:hypothetical protein